MLGAINLSGGAVEWLTQLAWGQGPEATAHAFEEAATTADRCHYDRARAEIALDQLIGELYRQNDRDHPAHYGREP